MSELSIDGTFEGSDTGCIHIPVRPSFLCISSRTKAAATKGTSAGVLVVLRQSSAGFWTLAAPSVCT